MSRILEDEELEEVLEIMKFAVIKSLESPCKTDKRGVVIVKDRVIGVGVNSPPEGFECCPEYCEPTCRDYAVHAEMNAIADANDKGTSVKGARLYHAKSENEELVISRKPRCVDCSKHILAFGISEVVLNREEGLTVYDALEFHRLSLNYERKD